MESARVVIDYFIYISKSKTEKIIVTSSDIIQQKMQKFKQLQSRLHSLPIAQNSQLDAYSTSTGNAFQPFQNFERESSLEKSSPLHHSQSNPQFRNLQLHSGYIPNEPQQYAGKYRAENDFLANNNQGLNSIPNKAKLKTLQNLVTRLIHSQEEDSINQEYRIDAYLQQIRKIENAGKDSAEKMETRQHNHRNQLLKIEKIIRKGSQKMLKERKQVDKKMQSSLENYLIELTGFKTKVQSGCQSSIKQLQNLQAEVEQTAKQIQNQTLISKEIMKKVFSQFTTQIDQIGGLIGDERKQREQQQDMIINSLDRVYNKMTNDLSHIRKSREKNDKQAVDLLERVIEKVRGQLCRE